jgi:hypothetical protein
MDGGQEPLKGQAQRECWCSILNTVSRASGKHIGERMNRTKTNRATEDMLRTEVVRESMRKKMAAEQAHENQTSERVSERQRETQRHRDTETGRHRDTEIQRQKEKSVALRA